MPRRGCDGSPLARGAVKHLRMRIDSMQNVLKVCNPSGFLSESRVPMTVKVFVFLVKGSLGLKTPRTAEAAALASRRDNRGEPP